MPERSHVRPEDNFPTYFRLEAGCGTERELPLATAVGTFADEMLHLAHRMAASASPAHLRDERQRELLGNLGIASTTLDTAAVDRLYESIHGILAARGTLAAVRALAEIYFEQAEIHRGRPFERAYLAPTRHAMRLADGDDRRRVVFVRIGDGFSAERIAEFRANCTRLVPHGFEVVVSTPQDPKERAPRLRLDRPFPLQQRRM